MRHISILLTAAAAVLCSASGLFAQAQGFGGSLISGQGGSGSGGSGSSFGGGTSGAGMGSSTASSSTTGMSMLYASNLSGGFGSLGFGSANGFGSSTGASSQYGGRTYGSVTGAGGASTTGTPNGSRTSTTNSSSTAGRGGSGASSSTARRGGRNSTASTTKEQPVWFEPRIEVGFDVPPASTTAVASNVAAALGVNKAGSRFGGVRVSILGQTAILRGTVASLNDRILAEQIVLLEPAITNVRNDLTIQTRTAVSSVR